MIGYRDALPADGPSLDAVAQEIWRDTFSHSASAEDIATYLAKAYGPDGTLIRDLNEGTGQFRLALSGERIIGYAKINPPWLPDAEPGAMQLSQIYVHRDFQGEGVAHALMEWAIQTSRAAGALSLLLTVWEENKRAIRFYEKKGFVHVGDYAFAVGNQIDTDHILRFAL